MRLGRVTKGVLVLLVALSGACAGRHVRAPRDAEVQAADVEPDRRPADCASSELQEMTAADVAAGELEHRDASAEETAATRAEVLDQTGQDGEAEAGGEAEAATEVSDADAVELEVPAAAGEPCAKDEDCAEGGCVGTPYGAICAPPCGPLCPAGWKCLDTGDVELCLPTQPEACVPCLPGNCPEAWCGSIGWEGDFCLVPCPDEGTCPVGFACVATGVPALKLCTPVLPSCSCAPAQSGQVIPCFTTNEFGTCEGTGLCDPEIGLTDCTAAAAMPEKCNGQDDDCDGQVDEEWPLLGKPCDDDDPDVCMAGDWVCLPDGSGMVCVGDIPFPEQCNGLDDDCDGELDEEWPKKGEVCGISPLCGIVHWGCNAAKTGLACNLLPVQEQCDGKDNDCDGYTDEGYLDMNKNGIADCIE